MVIVVISVVFCIYLFFALYALFLNSGRKLNRIFFSIALLFALISLISIFLLKFALPGKTEQLLFKSTVIFYISNLYLTLIFYANLVHITKTVRYFIFCLAFPVVYIILIVLVKCSYTFDHEYDITYWIINKSDVFVHHVQNQTSVVNLLIILTAVFILISGYRRSTSIRIKKQIIVILITFTVSYIITFIDYGILFQLSNSPEPKRIVGTVLLYNLIWIGGIWYSLVKYRFLSLDTATISRDIISSIDEIVVLLGPDLHILTVNRKLQETIDSEGNLNGKPISCLITEHVTIADELKTHQNDNEMSLSCKINLIDQEKNRIGVEAKIKMIRDKFGDIIGYLIVAKELKSLKYLQEICKITRREANVIQAVIAGQTNHKIAEDLDITERTVKSHMTHIFNKLAVNNRIQLLIKLKDFKLIPESQADKILFIKETL